MEERKAAVLAALGPEAPDGVRERLVRRAAEQLRTRPRTIEDDPEGHAARVAGVLDEPHPALLALLFQVNGAAFERFEELATECESGSLLQGGGAERVVAALLKDFELPVVATVLLASRTLRDSLRAEADACLGVLTTRGAEELVSPPGPASGAVAGDALERLESVLARLAGLLETEVASLRAGAAPDIGLAAVWEAAGHAYDELLSSLHAEGLLVDVDGRPSIPSLRESVRAAEEARDRTAEVASLAQKARAVLSVAATLEADQGPTTEILRPLLGRVAAMRQELEGEGEPDWLAALIDGSHPIALLVRYLAGDDLEGEQEAHLDEHVRAEHGPALARAVLARRVRLRLPEPAGKDESDSSIAPGGRAPEAEPSEEPAPEAGPDLESEDAAGEAGEVPDPYLDQEGEAAPAEAAGSAEAASGPAVAYAQGAQAPPSSGSSPDAPAADELTGGQAGANGGAGAPPEPKAVIPAPAEAEDLLDAAGAESAEGPRLEAGGAERPLPPSAAGTELPDDPAAVRQGAGDPAQAGIWSALEGGRYSLAYQLSRCVERSDPPTDLLGLLTLAREIRSPVGEIAQALRQRFEASQRLAGEREDRAGVLLFAAAALRPALLAPLTGATTLIAQVSLGIPPLQRLASTIAGYGERLNGLDPGALSTGLTLTHWRAQLEELQQEARDYLARAASRSTKFARATDVWRRWLREGGLVAELLAPVLQDEASRADWLSARIRTLDIADEARSTVAELQHPHREEIIARALDQLRNNSEEAVEIAERWLRLNSIRPVSQDYRHRTIADARTDLVDQFREAQLALAPLLAAPDRRVRVASGVLSRSIGELEALFTAEPVVVAEARPAAVLSAALLHTRLELDTSREPESGDPETVIGGLLQALSEEEDWAAAYDRRVERVELGDARRIVDLLQDQSHPLAARLAAGWRQHVRTALDSLRRDLDTTRRTLDQNVVQGILSEHDRARIDARLVSVAQRIDLVEDTEGAEWVRLPAEAVQFAGLHQELAAVRRELEARLEDRHAEIRARMAEARLTEDQAGRIEVLLERGDVLTAEEYINLGAQGQFPEAEHESASEMPTFFPEAARQIEEFLQHDFDKLPRQLRAHRNIAGLPMNRVPGAQAEQAAEAVGAWGEMKGKQRFSPAALSRVLTFLGFQEVNVDTHIAGAETVFRAKPVQDRNEIPTELYGSRAGGKYRVIGVWNRPSEEELLVRVGDTHHQAATIVVYFGRMTEQRRRGLARVSRERRRTFVVLDETLLVYLCAQRGARLPVFFREAMPFTHSEPYVTTGGPVPPEMFFGREQERDEILSPRGSSFLYGGRQLGKTALLKHVERMYHGPDRGWVVRFLDLRNQGIGITQGTSEVWPLVVRELAAAGVIPARSAVSARTPERVHEYVTTWLEASPHRRIVLLLDEADRFLQLDAQEHFVQTLHFKHLMESTDRRFKVVFAGLHNVVRTTHQANHPLGHFGHPIAIGPLFSNGQVRASRALIEEPFRLLGHQFESPELVFRILAQANYYPSLIQIYGHHLLRNLQRRFDERSRTTELGPPFSITRTQVDEVYRGRDLRSEIERRFSLTLELDTRYEVVAYAIANLVLERDVSLESGASPERIRREALAWWPEGFQRMSGEDFRVLLDEMVALGVLRHTSASAYSLRSANVLLLMGSEKRVEEVLVDKQRDLPAPYDPAAFRERIGDSPPRMSPLTHQQVSHLRQQRNGVTVIAGSEATGLPAVPAFLRSARGSDFHLFRGGPLASDFERWLATLEVDEDVTSLVYVGPEHPWDSEWVDAALTRVGRLRTRRMRVAFGSDPGSTWTQLGSFDAWSEKGVAVIELLPWHDSALTDWLEAQGVGGSSRDAFRAATGGLPYLIERYLKRLEAGVNWASALSETQADLSDPVAVEEVRNALGLAVAEAACVKTLRALADWKEPMTFADLSALLQEEGEDPAALPRILRWAELHHLAHQAQANVWAIDPLVAAVLPAPA